MLIEEEEKLKENIKLVIESHYKIKEQIDKVIDMVNKLSDKITEVIELMNLSGSNNLVDRRELITLINILAKHNIIDPIEWDEEEARVGKEISEVWSQEYKRLQNEKNKHTSERNQN